MKRQWRRPRPHRVEKDRHQSGKRQARAVQSARSARLRLVRTEERSDDRIVVHDAVPFRPNSTRTLLAQWYKTRYAQHPRRAPDELGEQTQPERGRPLIVLLATCVYLYAWNPPSPNLARICASRHAKSSLPAPRTHRFGVKRPRICAYGVGCCSYSAQIRYIPHGGRSRHSSPPLTSSCPTLLEHCITLHCAQGWRGESCICACVCTRTVP